MTGQPHYPHADGDVAVLGPEVFASADGQTITWQGANYRRDHGPDPERRDQLDAALAALGKSEIELAEVRAALARVRAIADRLAVQQHGVDIEADSLRRAVAKDIHAALDQPAAHNAGPTIRECAEVDRRWPLEKHGE